MWLSTIFVAVTAFTAWTKAQITTTAQLTTTASAAQISTTASTVRSSTTTPTSSSAVVTHSIAAGAVWISSQIAMKERVLINSQEGFKFSPNTVTNASIGDIIEFRFYPTGHSVVRAEYKLPCIPYEDTGPNKVGFYSGFIDVATITNNGPTFSVRVNNTEPIFFYCAAPGSCIDNYMIGVINPNETETLAVQLEYAKNATLQMTPGEAMPSETAKSTSTKATSTSTSTSTPGSSSDDDHHHLSAGAIAGIAIGGAVVLLLAGALVYLCGRRGGFDKAYYRQSRHGHGANPPTMVEANYHHPGSGPKSPGQETFATTAYSTTPSNDPYQPSQPGHGVAPTGYPVGSSASPPPRSVHSQGSYQLYGGAPGAGSPLMQGVDGGKVQNGYLNAPNPTGQPRQELSPQTVAPVELPTSGDPGNSPLPSYSNGPRTFSWSTGGEETYRPGKPT